MKTPNDWEGGRVTDCLCVWLSGPPSLTTFMGVHRISLLVLCLKRHIGEKSKGSLSGEGWCWVSSFSDPYFLACHWIRISQFHKCTYLVYPVCKTSPYSVIILFTELTRYLEKCFVDVVKLVIQTHKANILFGEEFEPGHNDIPSSEILQPSQVSLILSLKNISFKGVMSCGLVEVYHRFRRTCHLFLTNFLRNVG
jgi:hypothetical protein